jgi:hypothetical protein
MEEYMKKALMLLLVIVVAGWMPSMAGAEMAASPWTEETTYGGKVTGKLDFGVRNAFGGWTLIATEPYDHWKDKKNIAGGIGEGIFYGVVDTIGGVLHIATFPLPVDVPLPEGGVQF